MIKYMHLQKFVDFGWPNEVLENPPGSLKSPSYDGFTRIHLKETFKSAHSQSVQNGGNLNTDVCQTTFDPELVGNENWSGDCAMWAQVKKL